MIASTAPAFAREQLERGFLFAMILLVGLLVIAAFGARALNGDTSFTGLPWWFHLHAVPMVSWVGLIGYQSWLVWRGNIPMHRRIGWLGAGLASYWLCPVGSSRPSR